MKIKLETIQFTELDYKVETFTQSITRDIEIAVEFTNIFDDKKPKNFAVVFDLKLGKEQKFKLRLKATAHFVTSEVITESEKDSPYITINAPAIAFPYIRTFISNLTLNSGYNPIMLPPVNFVELAGTGEI